MSNSELDEINRLRVSEGLPPIEPATVRCLRCDAEFESWDKRNNRVCNECKSDDEFNSQCETYDLPEEYLCRLKSTNIYDRLLLSIEYGFNHGPTRRENPDTISIDTTLMDKDDW